VEPRKEEITNFGYLDVHKINFMATVAGGTFVVIVRWFD
jgi:hypothetical protein